MNITIITDASFDHHYKAAGYAYWLASGRGKIGGGGPLGASIRSSNLAEMLAVTHTLFNVSQMDYVQPGDSLLIQTDCQAAIDAFTAKRTLRCHDERRQVDYFNYVKQFLFLHVQFRHVKGHTSRANREPRFVTNRLCDVRAKAGMAEARLQEIASQNINSIRRIFDE